MRRIASPGLPYWLAILVIFSWMYLPTLRWLYGRYTQVDTYYSHGFLIPFVTALLIWQKRDALRKIPIDYSWWGLALIVSALLLHLISTVFYVFFPSGLSVFVLAFGISMFFFGKARTKEILFPLSFLIFMFPLPSSAINTISLPMKELVTNLGARFVSAIGIPVHHSGFYVDTAKGTLLIDDPCSGIRSLIAFMALGAVAGYIGKASTMMRVLLFAISILVALLMNTLRVSFLVGVTSHYGSGAAAPDTWAHDLSGYASFAIGALLLFEINRLLEWKK